MDRTIGHSTDEIDLGFISSRLLSKWKFLVVALLLGAGAGFVISKRIPKTYASEATIFVQQSGFASGLLANLPMGLASKNGGSSDYVISLLQSDTMLCGVASELRLASSARFAHTKNRENAALRSLRNSISVTENKDGAIEIAARADSPYLAARIANSMLDILANLVVTNSTRKADFIEQKLKETTAKLHVAEDKLLRFQQKHDVAMIDEEVKAMIDQFKDLDGRLIASTMDLEQVNTELANAGELNTLVDLEVRKKSIESSRNYLAERVKELQAKLAAQPSVAMEYGRLQRQIGVLNKTFELLTEQYELANISKHGEDGDYQVIDRARPDMQAIAPKTKLNTALGGVLGLFVAAFLVISTNKAAYRKYRTQQA